MIHDRLSRFLRNYKENDGFKLEFWTVVHAALVISIVAIVVVFALGAGSESSILNKSFLDWVYEARVWEVLLAVIIIGWITKD